MEGKVNVGIINASPWLQRDKRKSQQKKPKFSPLKYLTEITSEVSESSVLGGKFSAKLDSHLPLVFSIVYVPGDARLSTIIKVTMRSVPY